MIWSTAERRCNRHHYFRWRGNISSRYTRQWLLVTSGSFDEQACPTFHTIFQDIGAGCVDVGMTTRKDYRRTIAFVEVIKENNTNERCWWCRHFCEKWTVCGLVSFLRRFRCGTSNGNISGWSPEGVAKIGIIMKYIQHKQLYKFFRLICRTSNCVLPDAMTKNIYQLYPFVRDTGYQAGAYVMSASTVLAQFVVSKVDPPFPDIWSHLLSSYPGAYDPTNSTLTPLRAWLLRLPPHWPGAWTQVF